MLKWCSYHKAAEPAEGFTAGRYNCRDGEREYTKRRRRTLIGQLTTAASNLNQRHGANKLTGKELLSWLGEPKACYLCGLGFNDDYTIDHLIPFSAGGQATRYNLDWAHVRCNKAKGDMLVFDFVTMAHNIDQHSFKAFTGAGS